MLICSSFFLQTGPQQNCADLGITKFICLCITTKSSRPAVPGLYWLKTPGPSCHHKNSWTPPCSGWESCGGEAYSYWSPFPPFGQSLARLGTRPGPTSIFLSYVALSPDIFRNVRRNSAAIIHLVLVVALASCPSPLKLFLQGSIGGGGGRSMQEEYERGVEGLP